MKTLLVSIQAIIGYVVYSQVLKGTATQHELYYSLDVRPMVGSSKCQFFL